jgi:prophage regulatory protein
MAEQLRNALAILRRKQVQSQAGLPTSTLYRKIALGEFPAPIRLGERSVGWIAAEVDDWIAQRIAQSRGPRA